MSAIKQSFSASLRPVTPLHAFHRLCVKLNHTTDIQQRLNLVSCVVETVSEGEKFYINRKLKVSYFNCLQNLKKSYEYQSKRGLS
jgi:hypothetical protein